MKGRKNMKNMKEKLGAKLKKKNGFTLIEMLVVIAIIVILVLVSIPMVNSSMDKARKATDDANVRAAKAEAAIEYLLNETTGTKYYDADTGKLVDKKPSKGYGQLKGTGDDDHKDKVIEVSISTADGTEGDITCQWVAKE